MKTGPQLRLEIVAMFGKGLPMLQLVDKLTAWAIGERNSLIRELKGDAAAQIFEIYGEDEQIHPHRSESLCCVLMRSAPGGPIPVKVFLDVPSAAVITWRKRGHHIVVLPVDRSCIDPRSLGPDVLTAGP